MVSRGLDSPGSRVIMNQNDDVLLRQSTTECLFMIYLAVYAYICRLD
jgi:hypothetical protein